MLTDKQKQLISETYVIVSRRAYSTAEIFYERLFTVAPSLKGMFKTDMVEMRHKFIGQIGDVVKAMEQGKDATQALQALGQRHIRYGVQPHYYQVFGEAFLWALEQVIGDRFTPEVREAWAALYNTIADTAKDSVYK